MKKFLIVALASLQSIMVMAQVKTSELEIENRANTQVTGDLNLIQGQIKMEATSPRIYLIENDVPDRNIWINLAGGKLGFTEVGDNNENPEERLTINGNTNRVGINQTTPQFTLDVNGSLGASGVTLNHTVPFIRMIENDTEDENWQIQGNAGRFGIYTMNDDVSNFSEKFSILNNGYVGISNTNPKYLLDANGKIKGTHMMVDGSSGVSRAIGSYNFAGITSNFPVKLDVNGALFARYGIYVATGGSYGAAIDMHVLKVSTNQNMRYTARPTGWNVKMESDADSRAAVLLNFYSGHSTPFSSTGNALLNNLDTTPTLTLYAKNTSSSDRRVGIGITNPQEKLHVNGKIKTAANTWADFVFEESYELPKLEEVENHIEAHGHLKDIPAEEEILKEGYVLGDMDSKLLQKIEELTLYLIEQNKEMKDLKSRLEKAEKSLEEFDK